MKPLFPLLAMASLAACGVKPSSSSETKTLIGEPTLSFVTDGDLDRVPFARAMGNIVTFVRFPFDGQEIVDAAPTCSGFWVGPRHFLTNAHCRFGTDATFVHRGNVAKAASTPALTFQRFGIGEEAAVRLGFTGETLGKAEDEVDATEGRGTLLAKDEALDYALYETSGPAVASWVDLRQATESADSLTLLGFPNGVPLTRSTACGVQGIKRSIVAHDCDSATGSSGGLLVDAVSGRPFALHHTGSFVNLFATYERTGRFESADELALAQCRALSPAPKGDALAACLGDHKWNRATRLIDVSNSLRHDHAEAYSALEASLPRPAP